MSHPRIQPYHGDMPTRLEPSSTRFLRVLNTARETFEEHRRSVIDLIPVGAHKAALLPVLRREAVLTAALFHSCRRYLVVAGAVLAYGSAAALAIWMITTPGTQGSLLSQADESELAVALILATIGLAVWIGGYSRLTPARANALMSGTLACFLILFFIRETRIAAMTAWLTFGPIVVTHHLVDRALSYAARQLAVAGLSSRSGSLTSAQAAACLLAWQLSSLMQARRDWDLPAQRSQLCRGIGLTARAVGRALAKNTAARGGDPTLVEPHAVGLASALYLLQERLAVSRSQKEYDRICRDLSLYAYLVAMADWSVFDSVPTRLRRPRWSLSMLAQPAALTAAALFLIVFQREEGGVQSAITLFAAAAVSFQVINADTRSTIIDTIRGSGKNS
jgi:hypothetical protein